MLCPFQESYKQIFVFSRDESVKLPVTSNFEKITLDPALAEKLKPVEVKPGIR